MSLSRDAHAHESLDRGGDTPGQRGGSERRHRAGQWVAETHLLSWPLKPNGEHTHAVPVTEAPSTALGTRAQLLQWPREAEGEGCAETQGGA